jgi:hypothetical protein
MEVFTGDPTKSIDAATVNTDAQTTSSVPSQEQFQQEKEIDPYQILNVAPPGASPEEAEMIKKRAKDLYEQDPLLYDETQTQDLFPGLAPVRDVGGYSGQILGYNPMYGGGVNVLPVGAILERKKAKARAAAAKAKAMSEIKMPTIDRYKKAVAAQKNLDKSFNQVTNRFWEQAVKDFGPEYAKVALTSTDTSLGRDYLNFAQDMNTLVAEGDKVFTMLEEVDTDIKKGGVTFSPKMREIRNKVYQTQGDLEMNGELNPFKLAEYVKNIKELKGYYSMEKLVHDRGLDKIKGDILQKAGIDPSNADFLAEWTTKTTQFDSSIKEIAKNLAQGELREQITDGIYTEKDIEEYLRGILGSEEIKTRKAKMKSDGAGSRIDKNTAKEISQSAGRYDYTTTNKQGEVIQASIPMRPGATMPTSSKPIKMGNIDYIGSDGITKRMGNTQSLKLIQGGIYMPPSVEGEYFKEEPVFVAEIESLDMRQVPKTVYNERTRQNDPVLDERGQQVFETKKEVRLEKLPVVLNERLESAIYSNWKDLGFDSLETAKEMVKEMKANSKSGTNPTIPSKGKTKKETEADEFNLND